MLFQFSAHGHTLSCVETLHKHHLESGAPMKRAGLGPPLSPSMSQNPAAPLPPIRVRVPASTSNLGPGFDCLGLALSLHLDAELIGPRGDDVGQHRISRASGEAKAWPTGSDNMFLQAFSAAVDRLGLTGQALQAMDFACASRIPVARGLGSSGAARIAGLLLGRELARRTRQGDDIDDMTLAHWAHEMEGHPDNSTASLFGGCTLALPDEGQLRVIHTPVHPSIAFAVAWPRNPVTTADARRVLPSSVAFDDAVENPRRFAFLLEGLRTGDGELLRAGLIDRLHVDHRLPLTPGAREAIGAALTAGAHGATLSGSGSALVALCANERVTAVTDAMATALQVHGGETVAGHVLSPVTGGPVIS